MVVPRKVPFEYVYRKLSESDLGYDEEDRPELTRESLMQLAGPNPELVQITKLKNLFRRWGDYRDFRDAHCRDVPEEEWRNLEDNTTNATCRKYARKFSGARSSSSDSDSSAGSSRVRSRSRSRSRKLKLKAFRKGYRGSRDDEDINTAFMKIDPATKGRDKKDVNFPKPICRVIRAVCPRYDAKRRYTKTIPDGSEDDLYDFDVSYTRE